MDRWLNEWTDEQPTGSWINGQMNTLIDMHMDGWTVEIGIQVFTSKFTCSTIHYSMV